MNEFSFRRNMEGISSQIPIQNQIVIVPEAEHNKVDADQRQRIAEIIKKEELGQELSKEEIDILVMDSEYQQQKSHQAVESYRKIYWECLEEGKRKMGAPRPQTLFQAFKSLSSTHKIFIVTIGVVGLRTTCEILKSIAGKI